jgi:predicted CXXCH cytochrome family protein
MSKIKVSFSFLLTLMLVAMFSIVASAAGSNPVVTPPGDPADVQAGVVTTDGANDNSYDGTVKSNANKTGTGIGTNDGSAFGQVIKSDDMVKADGSHGTQRTHGSYMNNTNSCASCHQTHTGASKNLLFKDGEYATCTACHDGTLGFYNVYTGSDSAGKFGGTHDGNMSVHLANGTVELKAAPGGNNNGIDNWTAEFTCASCHAPHGSYSDRLLSPDPNGMGNLPADKGGKKVTNVPVVSNQDINTKIQRETLRIMMQRVHL